MKESKRLIECGQFLRANGNGACREAMEIVHFILSTMKFIEDRDKEGHNKYAHL